MVTMEAIKQFVIEKGFGLEVKTLPDWYWSKGISYAYDQDPELWKPYVAAALKTVGTENYGGFYAADEKPISGKEYYICESPFGSTIDTGIIMHREKGTIKMYFQFER